MDAWGLGNNLPLREAKNTSGRNGRDSEEKSSQKMKSHYAMLNFHLYPLDDGE